MSPPATKVVGIFPQLVIAGFYPAPENIFDSQGFSARAREGFSTDRRPRRPVATFAQAAAYERLTVPSVLLGGRQPEVDTDVLGNANAAPGFQPWRSLQSFENMLDRAQRFPLATPFRYRTLGETGWKAGVTVNLSRSGVLFAAEDPVRPGMAIEMWFTLPAVADNAAGAQVVGSGFVVRADDAVEPPRLAARFHHYTMARSSAPD